MEQPQRQTKVIPRLSMRESKRRESIRQLLIDRKPYKGNIVDDKARFTLMKDKTLRTEEDIEYCCKTLLHVNFINSTFKKYGMVIVKSIFKAMNFLEMPENVQILKHGEIGSNCYILFEGTCEALSPGWINHEGINIYDMTRINIIEQGVIIGDKSLIDKKPRTASIRTLTKCYLGELTKKDFQLIFENSKKIELNQEINFYKSMTLFSGCNRRFIEKFTYCMDIKEYNGGDFIVNQNEAINKVFVIRKGFVEVLYKTEKNIDTVFDLNYFSEIHSNDCKRFTESRLHEIKGNKKISNVHKLFVLGPGEIFGDIELLQGISQAHFSLVCRQQNSEILICTREKFVFNIGVILFKELKHHVKDKINNYRERFESLKIQKKLSDHTQESKLNNDIMERILADNKIKSEREKVKEEEMMLEDLEDDSDDVLNNRFNIKKKLLSTIKEENKNLQSSKLIKEIDNNKQINSSMSKLNLGINNNFSTGNIFNDTSKIFKNTLNLKSLKDVKNLKEDFKSSQNNLKIDEKEKEKLLQDKLLPNNNNLKNEKSPSKTLRKNEKAMLKTPTKNQVTPRTDENENSPSKSQPAQTTTNTKMFNKPQSHKATPHKKINYKKKSLITNSVFPNMKIRLNKNYLSSLDSKLHINKLNRKSDLTQVPNENNPFTSRTVSSHNPTINNDNPISPKFNSEGNFKHSPKRYSTTQNFTLTNKNSSQPIKSSFTLKPKSNFEENIFFLSKDNHLITKNTTTSFSRIPSLSFNINRPFYDKNVKTILKENSKFKFSECAEINKNFFLDKENFTHVLKNKYDFIKKNCSNNIFLDK